MHSLDHPVYTSFELKEVHHVLEEDLEAVVKDLREVQEKQLKLYRADIYSDQVFSTQPEYTVEMVYVPADERFAVDWIDGIEWIEGTEVEAVLKTWLDHHADV